jgi:hypothetical protein
VAQNWWARHELSLLVLSGLGRGGRLCCGLRSHRGLDQASSRASQPGVRRLPRSEGLRDLTGRLETMNAARSRHWPRRPCRTAGGPMGPGRVPGGGSIE